MFKFIRKAVQNYGFEFRAAALFVYIPEISRLQNMLGLAEFPVGGHTVSLCRPFCLLLLRTSLPCRLDILFRKPCFRFRLRFDLAVRLYFMF